MNLYEYSAKENEEIGIHTTNSELLKEIESYLAVAAGVYLYSIEAGEFRQTKKMILLK